MSCFNPISKALLFYTKPLTAINAKPAGFLISVTAMRTSSCLYLLWRPVLEMHTAYQAEFGVL